MKLTLTLPYLADEDEAAKYLKKSPASMQRDRYLGRGPWYVKLGRHVRYPVDELARHVRDNMVDTASSAD
jgi:hypothetical protein